MKQIIVFFLLLQSMKTYAQQTNYRFENTENTTAKGEKIWAIWIDVPNWKNWDKGLKDAKLENSFSVNSKGKLIPDKGPKSKFIITEVIDGKSYTFKTRIPFGWLIIKRTLEEKEGLTFFTHQVEFTGLLKKLFGKQLGTKYRKMLPEVMKEIKKIAEKQ